MSSTNLTISGKSVSFEGATINGEYPVKDAMVLRDKIIVLYDPDAQRNAFGQFRNLVGFTLDGQKIWTAELPTSLTGDCYVELGEKEPITAYSFQSYKCIIDPGNGRILHKEFLK